MTVRIHLAQPTPLAELAAWFRAHREDLLARLGRPGDPMQEQRALHRETHSMEYGREAPDMRPYSEHERTTARGDGLRWELALDVAYWNRAEIAAASLVLNCICEEGWRLSVTSHLRDSDRTDTLQVEAQGLPDVDALLDWLGSALAVPATPQQPPEASPSALRDAGAEGIAPTTPAPDETAVAWLRESTVGRLGDARVGCGNFWPRRYTRADGVETEGLCARLAVLSGAEAHIVGQGSELEIDGLRWRVLEVSKPENAPGLLRLLRLHVPGR